MQGEKKDHGIRQTINTETETTRMITPCSTPFVTPDPLVMLWTANGPVPPKDSHSHLPASPLEGRETTCRKPEVAQPNEAARGPADPCPSKMHASDKPVAAAAKPLAESFAMGFHAVFMYVCFDINSSIS